jgi:hypothetical protein
VTAYGACIATIAYDCIEAAFVTILPSRRVYIKITTSGKLTAYGACKATVARARIAAAVVTALASRWVSITITA